MLIGDSGIGRDLDGIMCLDRHDVLDKVTSVKSKILDDQINGVISVLDARNGNVPAYEICDITDPIQTKNEMKFVPYPQEQGGLR